MKISKLAWSTVTRKINDLVPHSHNPRKINEKQIKDLKRSLKKFNLVEIPVVDLDNTILAGHQRLMVLKLLGRGEEKIEVRIPNRKLTKQERDEYLLSSNRIHGDWDYDLLAEYFDMGSLKVSSFDDIDLSKIFDKHLEVQEENFDLEEELKKAKRTKIKVGDVIELGKHKLICGDSTDLVVVKKLVGKDKMSLINTDVPYNIGLDYNKGVGGKKSKKNYGGEVDDSKTTENYSAFISKLITNGLLVSEKDTHVFFWCDERFVWIFQSLYLKSGIDNKRLLIWVKNNASPTPQVAFNKVTEFCVYGTIGSPYLCKEMNNANEILNKEVTTGNQLQEDISNLLLVKRLSSKDYEHPTEKSPKLHEKILKRCTKVNDIVLDLTAGSGSILSACHQLNRVAYMCELSPVFCQVIVNRFNKLKYGK